MTGVSNLSPITSEEKKKGLYVTCHEADFTNKFYTFSYIKVEFDLLTEVPDVDHANHFTRHLIPVAPPFEKTERIEDVSGFYREYFFRYYLK